MDALEQCIRETPGVLIWFTGPNCRVCQELKPRVGRMIAERFPRIHCFQVDCAATPEVAAQLQVFSVPTLQIYLDGQPVIRKVRNFSLPGLEQELARPYTLLFE